MFNKLMLSLLLAFLIFSNGTMYAQQQAEKKVAAKNMVVDESIEPADSYKLLVNGSEYEIFAGKDTELPLKLDNPKISLKLEPFKTFNYGGIYLQYPRYYTFEADLADKEASFWNLSGKQSILMIQKYPAEMDHKIMATMLKPRFGEENTTVGECSMNLNGIVTKGSKVVASIGGSSISQEIFSFKLNSGSLLLILQNALNEKGEPSEEGQILRELLTSTFKIPAAG
ncbi:MAG: hypothetical protein PHV05_08555 [Candidatus Riflebacteria bacterium]|nr:hypothetical protein [Candidatus Riflebacteria bacterium]